MTLFRKLALAALLVSFIAALPMAATADSHARGEALFALCTQCHATDGGGNSQALAPAIAGLPQWYVEAQLQKFRDGIRGLHPDDTGGLRMYPMSQWVRSDEDLTALASYVASMPAVETERELEAHGDAARGQGLYALCSACHAADGSGNEGMGAPPLTGQSDWYLFQSIQKYKTGVRGSEPRDALGAAMIGMVATLPNDEAILDVIAHIQSMEK